MNRGRGSNRGGGGEGRHYASRGRSPRSADHYVPRRVPVILSNFVQFVFITFSGFPYCVGLLFVAIECCD